MSSRNAQGTGSLKIVYEYLEQLRALGKYEDTTIIITADHGVGKIVDTEKRVASQTRPQDRFYW